MRFASSAASMRFLGLASVSDVTKRRALLDRVQLRGLCCLRSFIQRAVVSTWDHPNARERSRCQPFRLLQQEDDTIKSASMNGRQRLAHAASPTRWLSPPRKIHFRRFAFSKIVV